MTTLLIGVVLLGIIMITLGPVVWVSVVGAIFTLLAAVVLFDRVVKANK